MKLKIVGIFGIICCFCSNGVSDFSVYNGMKYFKSPENSQMSNYKNDELVSFHPYQFLKSKIKCDINDSKSFICICAISSIFALSYIMYYMTFFDTQIKCNQYTNFTRNC